MSNPMRLPASLTLAAFLVAHASPGEAAPASVQIPLPDVEKVSVNNADLFRKSLDATRQAIVQYGALERPADLRRVADIGYRLVAAAGVKQPPINFYLVDLPEPNAFALPGGQVVVTRGMLDLGLDDDQLAALLGHEVAHVVLQHGTKMERRATLLNLLSQAALVGVILSADSGPRTNDPYLAYGRSEEKSDLIQGTAAAGIVLSELLLRGYSREFEDQADEEGQRWAAAAGFEPVGTKNLFDLMRRRLPQDKQYGYWQTHPFFDSRVQAAEARGRELKRQEPRDVSDLRRATQVALLDFARGLKPDPPRESVAVRVETGARERAPRDLDLATLLKRAALAADPASPAAEGLRAERLALEREREMARLPLARDFGRLLDLWQREIDDVRAVSPETPFLAKLAEERAEFERRAEETYPKAVETFRTGVYETAFLETFASNYPARPEFAEVSLSLGDAYARLGRSQDAVESYLAAWRAAGSSPIGVRARGGLRGLVGVLKDLPALQELAEQAEDDDLRQSALRRLESTVGEFTDLSNGAAYLRRYPANPHSDKVTQRLYALADNLYGEVVLYRSVGDHAKALDRIQQILNHAPASPAAQKLRDKATVIEHKSTVDG
jgi:Zn-dependent protease with chaperone function/tetratricopeptide (TPR) repeat protein